MPRWLRGLGNWFARRSGDLWIGRRIKTLIVTERPRRLRRGRLYVTRQANGPAFGFMLCPCGCAETIHLRFFGARRPRWRLLSMRGPATVWPSVWRSTGCRSHFFLTRGRIDWCE